MLMKDGRSLSNVLELLSSPHILAHLLKTRQYDELGELLAQAQTSIQQIGHDDLLSGLLVVAHQICAACKILQEETAWHRWASSDAERREQELAYSLQVITDTLNNVLGKTYDQPDIITLPASKIAEPGDKNSLNRNGPNLFQHLQKLLRLEKNPAISEMAWFTTPMQVKIIPRNDDRLFIPEAVETTSGYEAIEAHQGKPQGLFSLVIYSLGAFQVYFNDQLIDNWPNRKSKSVFKYLILHRARPAPKEVLMECFWPDADIEAARNNLNVTIYNLRQTLRRDDSAFSHILFQDDCYLLNPDLDIWVDFEQFTEHFNQAQLLERAGALIQAVDEYGAAELLYQGQLFEEDRYEDWPASQRQKLHDTYLRLLDRLSTYYLDEGIYTACVSVSNKMLAVDSCREDAHRRLMICYSRQGQHHLALRQYHVCVEQHMKELQTFPCPETVELFEKIRANQKL